jgi:hypothetical protein
MSVKLTTSSNTFSAAEIRLHGISVTFQEINLMASSAARLSSILAMLLAPTLTGAAQPSIENQELAVEFSASSGAILSMRRKDPARAYTAPNANAEVVRIRFPVGDWNGHGAWQSGRQAAHAIELV